MTKWTDRKYLSSASTGFADSLLRGASSNENALGVQELRNKSKNKIIATVLGKTSQVNCTAKSQAERTAWPGLHGPRV